MITAQYVNTFRIGSDPEFCMLNADNLVVHHRFTGDGDREIGNDGGGAHIVELRPKPAFSVNQHMLNIKTLLEKPTLNKARKFKWRAGAMVQFNGEVDINNRVEYSGTTSTAAIGGHIHIEVPYVTNTSMSDEGIKSAVPKTMFDLRLKAWDLVTKSCEEVGILPKEESELRRRGHYGKFGAYHQVGGQDRTGTMIDEGPMRVEYRTPCSWLFNPKNAFAYITALKIATVSPIAVMRALEKESNPVALFSNLIKLFRNYQNVDHDAWIVAKKLLTNTTVYDKIQADPDVDFKTTWNLKTPIFTEYAKSSKTSGELPVTVTPPPVTVTPNSTWSVEF